MRESIFAICGFIAGSISTVFGIKALMKSELFKETLSEKMTDKFLDVFFEELEKNDLEIVKKASSK